MKRYLTVGIISGILISIVVAFSWYRFPAWQNPAVGGFWGLLGATIVGVVVFVQSLVSIWKDLKEEEQGKEQKLPLQVDLSAGKYTFPRYNTQVVGVILYNHENHDLTDVYIKLVKVNHQGFNDELGGWEIIPITINEDNRLFNLGDISIIRANDDESFKLVEIQDNSVVFLLKKRPFAPKPRYPHHQGKYSIAHGKWEIEFVVGGKISGYSFKKERFVVAIDATRIESFADSTLNDSITIDIKGEIIHIQSEETSSKKDNAPE